MTRIKQITTILIVILFIGCEQKNHERNNEITRIVFATGGCYGTCPIQAIDIDSTLNFNYHGVRYTRKKGFYTGVVTKGFWDTLNMKLENINFKELDTTYEYSVDGLSTEIFIYYNNKVKHIHGEYSDLPDSVRIVYDWLLTSIGTFKFKPTQKRLTFPTIIQKPMEELMPENIEFISPIVGGNYE
ncbi:MAG TPA: DUF6438 domain-containing protein [Crocinitomicaceae bacterium]|nr:DUF6438 domain-containing protein [Crocinitomicaceae bacterium]